jgi:hypothetical protein
VLTQDFDFALYGPLAEAYMCLEDDCDAVFFAGLRACPACASDHIAPISKFLNREA